jgi:pilus assembly protein CpaF
MVLKEVQEYISANYSELITNQELEDAKEQLKRYIRKYVMDEKIAVKGMEGQELIDALYTEMAESFIENEMNFST